MYNKSGTKEVVVCPITTNNHLVGYLSVDYTFSGAELDVSIVQAYLPRIERIDNVR